ncbi:MAG: 4Fe-4S double cluster binding domain-containing protein [Candidatus Aminicenantales bacterium]
MPDNLTDRLRARALANDIDMIGITSAKPLARNQKIVDPLDTLNDARAVVVAGFCMKEDDRIDSPPSGSPTGKYSRAYNVRAFTRLEEYYVKTVSGFLKKEGYKAVFNKNYQIPDKPAAVRAGLGGYGKNGVVVTERFGSCVMFATIVTNAPLDAEEFPMHEADCGACDLCLRSCPTDAITGPFKVNRKLCITDWLWGAFVPAGLRKKQGDRLFGCGDCVRICPKNRKIEPRRSYPVLLEDVSERPELIPLITADEAYFKRVIPSFPMRAGIEALRGNAIIALGNAADAAAIEPLGWALDHGGPQIRSYSAWALGRIGGGKAVRLLRRAKSTEKEPGVIEEIEQAIASGTDRPNH